MYKISDMTKKEWRDFAMYTIADRAIPNLYDGLKPSQRFYLYSSIVNTPKNFANVDDVASSTKKYGYRHGSTDETGQGMASEWKNNLCLIEGEGSFGSRLIQFAAAPRYTKTRLHKNFNKFIKDIELSPVHDDPEHIPPAFYVPTIPLVLINGARGIATGWATLILPRSVESVTKACREYIETGEIKTKLEIQFPQFSGRVVDNGDGSFECHGSYKIISKTKMVINEVPYGYDRETYVTILDKLEEDNKIVGYDDHCDGNGFNFEIKLKRDFNMTDAKIMKEFKLITKVTENINVIGENNNLVHYDDPKQLIRDFVDYRMSVILSERIENSITQCVNEGAWSALKMKFVKLVLADKIEFKKRKKADVMSDIMSQLECNEERAERLLRMNLMSFTDELIKELNDNIKMQIQKIDYWKNTTPKDQFVLDLDDIGM